MKPLSTAAALLLASLALTAPSAQAAKQLYNYFGTPSGFGAVGGEFNSPGGVAVNQTGAGPAEAGEIYVVDHGLFGAPVNRIERFERDRHGTADPADDTYRFVSAWGAGVETGGDEYEVCSVAANCHAATASGGNGTASGNGDLSDPYGIAVDQDSGEVYVADAGNNRINVYAGDGAFLRSFGYDVVQSGPGRIAGPEAEQRLLVKADGGHFSLAFYGRATAARGAGRRQLKDKTIQNVTTTEGTFKVGEGISGECIPPGATIAAVGAGELTMSAKATCSDTEQSLLFGDNFAPAPAAAEVESALSALPTVGAVGGSVTVVRSELSATEFEYAIRFGGSLQGEDAPALEPTHEGLTLSGGTGSATVTKTIQSGALEVCRAAAGDVCKAGSAGTQTGEIGSEGSAYVVGAKGIALSPPDGNPATGRVFLADAGNQRIDSYDTEGESPSSFGAGQFTKGAYPPDDTPEAIAVDSRGIVYASDDNPHSIEPTIKRYDSEDANGEGVGFLAPIPTAVNELQQITVSASEGEFRLCFEGQCTEDMPFDVGAGVNSGELRAELEALPSTSTVFLSGGPGDAGGAHPYQVAFAGTLVGEDVEQLTCEDGAAPLGGGAGCSVTTLEQGKPGLQGRVKGLALRPDPDGAGPESDVLYTADYGDHGFGSGKGVVKQFGPLDPPGLTEPPGGFDELHGATSQLSQSIGGIAVDEASGDIYATDTEAASKEAHGVYVLGEAVVAQHKLAVHVTGEGEVSADSGTISGCTSAGGAECEGTYEDGATVTLTETPAEGSEFSGWATPQCDESTAATCEVTIGSEDEAVSASFAPEPLPEYPLTTHSEGSGEGTIECAPPGGACGPEREYVSGTTVTLTATPGSGSEFVEWTGACAGTLLPVCEVTIEAATEVGAVFGEVPTPEHTLTVSVSGEGEVSADSGAISGCTSAGGSSCEGSYEEGVTVTLAETAAGGSHFVSWATPQCDESSEPTCEVTIGSADEAVSASFEANSVSGPPLTLAIEEGKGTVVSDPTGIECTGEAPKSCDTEGVAEGTVTLTASPAPGYIFKNWRHCDHKEGEFGVNGRQCVIDLSEAKEVGANFTPVDSLALTKASGSGPGQVNSKPGGIACTYNCQSATASFKHGSGLTLTEKPAKHFHFVEFTNGSGSASSCDGVGTQTCTFTISSDSSIEAKFAEDAKHTLSLTKQGGGQALIKTKGPGTVCSYACGSASASFYEGETVEVRWKLAKGTSSIDWGTGSGTCSGAKAEAEGACTVTMSAARSLVAALG